MEFACQGNYLMIQNVPSSICQTVASSLKLIPSIPFCICLFCFGLLNEAVDGEIASTLCLLSGGSFSSSAIIITESFISSKVLMDVPMLITADVVREFS